jgi:hypothetical protein
MLKSKNHCSEPIIHLKEHCCNCEKTFINDNIMLIPLVCLQKHGKKAHKICEDCWWHPTIGFAREDRDHKCPGCKKGLSLIINTENTIEKIIIL